MTTYSAFFSSGLLAPRNVSHSYIYDPSSPVLPSSPLSDSDVELELETDREITPTPDTRPIPILAPAPQSRLRKRRSSLTIGASSPMNAIRSPQRTAGAALQLQMHLPNPSRSRSGSLSTTGANNVASQATSLVGRMRSGSVGAVFRPRRPARRLASVPAPAPAPTVPLPAIPSILLTPSSQNWFNAPHTAPLSGGFQYITQNTIDARTPFSVRATSDAVAAAVAQTTIKGRQRGFSISDNLTIDEEMKEN
ncbi:hypothetical protein H0H93_008942 [Arthromyces matolae]|nr:hypothetical protein H0H93_008942 [Arthromyces matolae]